MAILGNNNCFLSVAEDDDIVCNKAKAGASEYVWMRTMAQQIEDPNKGIPTEEQGSLAEVEVNYV